MPHLDPQHLAGVILLRPPAIATMKRIARAGQFAASWSGAYTNGLWYDPFGAAGKEPLREIDWDYFAI